MPEGPRAEPRHYLSSCSPVQLVWGTPSSSLRRRRHVDAPVERDAKRLWHPHHQSAESTESPHSIAVQVATVRYTVEVKWPLTWDNAQKRWSAKWRVLLCKQGVVGSSPIVSTA